VKQRGISTRFSVICVVSVLVALALMVACAAPAPTPKMGVLKVGTSLPMSGPAAAWGNPIAEATQIYVDLLNQDGGVTIGDTTYTLKLIVSDDKYTPEGVKASADRLVYTEKVDVVVGGWLPTLATVLAAECTAANIVFIQNVRELPGLAVVSPEHPTMFNLGDPQIQMMWVPIQLKQQGALPDIKTYAMLTKDDTIGRSTAETIIGLKEEWKAKYGLDMVYDAIFPIASVDMTPWLSAIAALKPKVDLIYAASATATNMALIAKQSHELGLDVPVVGIASLTDVGAFCDTAGYDASQYAYTIGCAPWQASGVSAEYLEMASRIRQVYRDKHGTDLTYGAAFGYCATQLAAYLEAAKIAGSTKTEDVVRALETQPIKHFYGTLMASGEETYGIKHRLMYDAMVVKVEGRETKFVVAFGEPIP